MKTAFSTLGCLDDTLEKVISYAVNNNIPGIELRVNADGEVFDRKTLRDSAEIKKAFSQAGIEITDLAISCSLKEYDEKQTQIGKDGIDFAFALGVAGVRIFAGANQKFFNDEDTSDRDGIIKALRELSDYAKEKNISLWLETHSTFSSGKSMRGLVDDIARENIFVIWDVLHSLEYKETPLETVSSLGNKIVHVHLKDGRPSENTELTQFIHCDLGDGVMNVKEVKNVLDGIGYDGFYSLEWEKPWREEIKHLYPDFNDLLKAYKAFLETES